jgi:hypothetical protein
MSAADQVHAARIHRTELVGRRGFAEILADLLADQAHAARVRGFHDYALQLETEAAVWRRRLEDLHAELHAVTAGQRLSLARAM